MLSPNWLRELAWRGGRKLYCYARNEPPNNPATNGEYWLLRQYAKLVPNVDPILDIGANVGDWTQNAIEALFGAGKRGTIHAFEPTKAAYKHLAERFSECSEVRLSNVAVTQNTSKLDIFVVAPCAGTNSLHPEPGAIVETVDAVSVDDYCIRHAIPRLGFVKSDVEGFDMDVLRGANQILKSGLCDIWQFEYNFRWINNRSFLRDVFEFIADKPYKFGKLYGNGIDFYDQWHPELERYFECNCVLIKTGSPIERFCNRIIFTKSNAGLMNKSHLR